MYVVIQQANIETESTTQPYHEDLKETQEKIKQVEKQLENFLEAIGETSRKTVNELMEKRIEKLQTRLSDLKKRKSELMLLITSSPDKINAQFVLNTLKGFSSLYDEFSNQERANYLQYLLHDVTIHKEAVNIRMYATKSSMLTGSKNSTLWLPSTRQLDSRVPRIAGDDLMPVEHVGEPRDPGRVNALPSGSRKQYPSGLIIEHLWQKYVAITWFLSIITE